MAKTPAETCLCEKREVLFGVVLTVPSSACPLHGEDQEREAVKMPMFFGNR